MTKENVQSLLPAANLLQLTDVNRFCLFVRWRWQRRMFNRCCLPPTCCSWRMWILSVLFVRWRWQRRMFSRCCLPLTCCSWRMWILSVLFVRWRWRRRMFSRCCLPPTCCSWRMWILSVLFVRWRWRRRMFSRCCQPPTCCSCTDVNPFCLFLLGGGDGGECSVAAASRQPAAADGCEGRLLRLPAGPVAPHQLPRHPQVLTLIRDYNFFRI